MYVLLLYNIAGGEKGTWKYLLILLINTSNFSLQQRKLAPGSYDIKDFLQLSEEKPRSILGICQTRDQRFKDNVAAVSENIKERASISGKSIFKNMQFCKHERASSSGKSIFKNMQFCKHARHHFLSVLEWDPWSWNIR